jgi:predicted Rossmann fold flavoprotein
VPPSDVIIVGAGAAGLATAIFAGRSMHRHAILVMDGARKPGAKILVSGGSRCNVTNSVVTEADFNGGNPRIIRRILRGLSVAETVAFFADLGVPLHEEPGGKLFPDSNRSRDVLDALMGACAAASVSVLADHRVTAISRTPDGFRVTTSRGVFTSPAVVLATGGRSLPKSGSDGGGYALAQSLGHRIVETTPALAPLVLSGADEWTVHPQLSGVAHDAALDLWVGGRREREIRGSLLWTHFGISGPAALDMSRHWLRARLDGGEVQLTARLVAGLGFEALERRLQEDAVERPRTSIQNALAALIPASLAEAVARRAGMDGAARLAQLARDDRRRLVHALTRWVLPVLDSRGYNYAEATAGGVPLTEMDPGTMASRVCPGLFLVGEILDVDGRIGGFNFQWAWSSARVAARALAARRGFSQVMPSSR